VEVEAVERDAIFETSAENAKIRDWLAEQGGLEPPVSREGFAKENGRKCWKLFRVTIRWHLPENEFVFRSYNFRR
jgi:hypothetical protein